MISVTKVLFESCHYRQKSYNSSSVHFFREKTENSVWYKLTRTKKMKSPEYRFNSIQPIWRKKSTKGGQGDERVVNFFFCFSTLKGNVAGEFRESKLKLSPVGLLDIHGDLKVIVKLNVKQRIITSFDWADLGSLFYKWVKIFEKQIIEHKIIHLKEYKT